MQDGAIGGHLPGMRHEQEGLRIGLLLEAGRPPSWLARVCDSIYGIAGARAVLVVELASASAPRVPLPYRGFRRLDARLFPVDPDALEPTDPGPRLSGLPRLRVQACPEAAGFRLPEADVEGIRRFDLDVLVCLSRARPTGSLVGVARHGVWSYWFGPDPVHESHPEGFWEVVEASPATVVGLRVVAETPERDRILYRSRSCTDARSPRRSMNACLWKASTFVDRALRRLVEEGTVPPQVAGPAAPPGPGRVHEPGAPGLFAVGRALWRIGSRYARDKLRERGSIEQWQVAYSVGADELDPTSMRALAPPLDRFWADPFPIWDGEHRYLLFEEFVHQEDKGVIAAVSVDSRGRAGEPFRVLERPYHLSYPFVFRWRGDWFLVPETAQNRTVEVFRALRFPHDWELCEVLLKGLEAVDATPFEVDGHWWMFVNVAPFGGSASDELHLFQSPGPLGPWSPHPRNPVKSDAASARPAGAVFAGPGGLYRPGQDCSGRYGRAIVVHRITRLDGQDYQEEPVGRIEPGWHRQVVAVHTLNRAGPLRAIDCVVRVPRRGAPDRGLRSSGSESAVASASRSGAARLPEA